MLASHGFDSNPEPFEAFNGSGKKMFGDAFELRDLRNFGAPWASFPPATRCKELRGIWGMPPISAEDRLVKMRDCLSRRLSHDQAEKLISIALRADERDAAGGRATVSLAH